MNESIRLAIADDNLEFCNLLEEYLSGEAGIDLVSISHDGHAAVEACRAHRPVLLLLDLVMPELDGIGVLDVLRSEDDRPKVLMFTAFGQEMLVQQAMELGADYYIMKPFNLPTLVQRIRQVCDSPSPMNIRYEHRRQAVEQEVTRYLTALGVPAHYKGCAYVKDAIQLVVEDSHFLSRITKGLYPAVADRHNTTPDKVERAIRHAIEATWTRGNLESIYDLFAHTVDLERAKPSNSNFIARIADQVRLDLGAGSSTA